SAFSSSCKACNFTAKSEARKNEILGKMRDFLGIRQETIDRALTEEMLQNARVDALRDLPEDEDEREKPESIHVFASGSGDLENPSAVFSFSHRTAKRTVLTANLGVHLRR
ncbi:hypothetical protein PFISCL1PPCAC_11237, partial [Pristionchus fissidentatus]